METAILTHYKKDGEGNYLIEIKIHSIEELFNVNDPNPINKRELNSKISAMIDNQIKIFGDENDVKLEIFIPEKLNGLLKENVVKKAIKNHFEYNYLESCLHLKRRLRKGKRTFGIAGFIFIFFIVISSVFGYLFKESILTNIISEGLFVGAWVSLWRPIEILLYEWIPLSEEKKRTSKIIKMPININYF
ncbi:MAG: hypothetical protein PHT94_00460 [Candidatus Nanoarchaeia archaeon]|nr:hypothetical protein [Candidatus Nanoarchaeia archaeon]